MNAFEYLSNNHDERIVNLFIDVLKLYGIYMMDMSSDESDDIFWIRFLESITDIELRLSLFDNIIDFFKDHDLNRFCVDMHYNSIQVEIQNMFFPTNIWIPRSININEGIDEMDTDMFYIDMYRMFYTASFVDETRCSSSIEEKYGHVYQYNRFRRGMIDLNKMIDTKSKTIGYQMQYDQCIQELAYHPSFMNQCIKDFDDIEDFFESMGY